MNIRDILTLTPGHGKSAIALFNTAFGELKLTSNPQWIDTSQYASLVDVYRSGDTWTITADPGMPPGPGDVAAITKIKSKQGAACRPLPHAVPDHGGVFSTCP